MQIQAHVGKVFFQLLHPLQGCVLGLGVLQQSPHVKNIVQVSLDLHLQLVTLCVLQLLQGGQGTGTWDRDTGDTGTQGQVTQGTGTRTEVTQGHGIQGMEVTQGQR